MRRLAQGTLEFAVALPIFLMLVFMVVELARVFYAWATIENNARAAARYLSTGQYDEAFCLSGCADEADREQARLQAGLMRAREILYGADAHPDGDSHPDTDVDLHPDGHRYAHAHPHPHAHADVDAYPHAHTDGVPAVRVHAHADPHAHPHPDADLDAYAHADPHTDADANHHAHPHAYAHANAHPDAYAGVDAHAHPDPHAHADPHTRRVGWVTISPRILAWNGEGRS